MRTSACFALLFVAAVGCGTDSTVSGVFPAEGFTGRSLRVEISGDATQWSGTPGVNFGQGVTVSNVTVASPTTLFADITVAPDATLGTRDVTVTNDGTFTLKQAFKLESPIEVTFQGVTAQGGIPYFTITNHDFDTPFDLTQDAAGNNVNLQVTGPTGVTLQVGAATAFQLTGFAFIDTDATSGPVSVVSGPMGGTTVVSNLGKNMDVTPRTAMPLADTGSGMLPDVGDSALYSVDVTNAPALLRIVASTSDANGQPVAALLPTGKWAEATSAARAILPSSGTVYVVVFDNGMASGYNFSLTKKAEMLTTAPEAAGTNDTTATALTATALPFLQTGGTLSDAADKDLIKVTLAAAGKLHVVAGSADGLTDTAVDVKSNATTSVLTPAGPRDSGDFSCLFAGQCGESVTSGMLAAGTYYVEVSAGPNWDASAKGYTALVYIE